MRTFRPNTLIILLFLCTATAFSQNKKLEKSYNTNKDVKINVDARHTNVVFETWDRNEVQIEATVDGKDLSAAEAKEILDNWKLETSGNAGEITITSGGGVIRHPNIDMAHLTESMGHLQELIAPIMTEMVGPMMENLAKHPPLPPDFADKMGNLNFNYEEYQKDGEKYMQKWEAQIEKNFGKDFEKSMEEWGAQFEKNAEMWEKNFAEKMEIDAENFEKSMEEWGEKFGAEMEKWGENFAKEMEQQEKMEGDARIKNYTKAVRNIKVRMPADAKLNLDVRHGEVKLGHRTNNLKANLSHSRLAGNIIEGRDTEVRASYTPIAVSQWNYGVLNTSYVQNCVIDKARSIKLNSNSSDVEIKEIQETGILSGTFGMLKIGKLNNGFKNLDISLKNSDLRLSLPQTAFNFNYNGKQSEIEYPQVATVKSSNSYDNQIVNGYYQAGNGNSNISINATFSDVVIK